MDDGVIEVIGFWSSTFVSDTLYSRLMMANLFLVDIGQATDGYSSWGENCPVPAFKDID